MDRAELARRLGAEPHVGEASETPVVIEEREPARFMAAFTDAVAAGGPVFLADPAWGPGERAQLNALTQSSFVIGHSSFPRGWLMIPSGGTSGRLKFARHDEETLGAAVRGFGDFFGMGRVNAIGVLPLYHVSGLMAWMRCALTGGDYVPCDWKRIETGEMPALAAGDWVVSLVPTQLQRLIGEARAVEWLRGFRAIFVGGGPVWPELADAVANAKLPVSLSYGMTETAAMVTALRPGEFLAGVRSSGSRLPHAKLRIDGEGRIVVGGASLFRGYYPERNDAREFATEDLGRIDERGHLHVLGRRDAVIITGGKKVQPAEVEAALRASGEFEDVAVIGVPDSEWGEAVVACYPSGGHVPALERAVVGLAAWQRPKQFVALAAWPRNANGKIDRGELMVAIGGRMSAQRGGKQPSPDLPSGGSPIAEC